MGQLQLSVLILAFGFLIGCSQNSDDGAAPSVPATGTPQSPNEPVADNVIAYLSFEEVEKDFISGSYSAMGGTCQGKITESQTGASYKKFDVNLDCTQYMSSNSSYSAEVNLPNLASVDAFILHLRTKTIKIEKFQLNNKTLTLSQSDVLSSIKWAYDSKTNLAVTYRNSRSLFENKRKDLIAKGICLSSKDYDFNKRTFKCEDNQLDKITKHQADIDSLKDYYRNLKSHFPALFRMTDYKGNPVYNYRFISDSSREEFGLFADRYDFMKQINAELTSKYQTDLRVTVVPSFYRTENSVLDYLDSSIAALISAADLLKKMDTQIALKNFTNVNLQLRNVSDKNTLYISHEAKVLRSSSSSGSVFKFTPKTLSISIDTTLVTQGLLESHVNIPDVSAQLSRLEKLNVMMDQLNLSLAEYNSNGVLGTLNDYNVQSIFDELFAVAEKEYFVTTSAKNLKNKTLVFHNEKLKSPCKDQFIYLTYAPGYSSTKYISENDSTIQTCLK